MKKLLKYSLLAAALFWVQGCATHTKFVKKYDSYVGHNISELMTQIGYPDSTFVLPNNNKVYVYERSRIYSIPNMSFGYGYGSYYGNYGMFGYGAEEIVQESCKLFLETNKKGLIVKWGSRGNSCVSN